MEEIVDFKKYPNLLLLLWDTPEKEMEAFDAFRLLDCRLSKYIKNSWLSDEEKELLHRLAEKFGGGVPIIREVWSNNVSPKEIIEVVTEHIDRRFLEAGQFCFSGGALSSIRHGGYRGCTDIEFLSSKIIPFNSIKDRVYGSADLKLAREPFIDKDAVMVWAICNENIIRMDFMCEHRFDFGITEDFYGVKALNNTDLMAYKLLAYSDSNISFNDIKTAKEISDILAIYKDCQETLAPAWDIALDVYSIWFGSAMKRLASIDSEVSVKDILIAGGVKGQFLEEFLQVIPSFCGEIRSLIKTVPDIQADPPGI